jgi:hypothetical protein
MAFTPTSPVTGAAVSGLTSPTYTLTADTAPSANGKQYAVTTLGGTQTGARTHSISSPFTMTFFKDPAPKQLPALNANGQLGSVPMVKHRLVLRQGQLPLAAQAYKTAVCRVEWDQPAGADVADVVQQKAFVSILGGTLYANANEIYNTLSTGVM